MAAVVVGLVVGSLVGAAPVEVRSSWKVLVGAAAAVGAVSV